MGRDLYWRNYNGNGDVNDITNYSLSELFKRVPNNLDSSETESSYEGTVRINSSDNIYFNSYEYSVLDTTPILYYKLDETSGSVIVNYGSETSSHDGVIVGGSTKNQDPIINVNKSMVFNGVDQYFYCDESDIFDGTLTKITYELWFSPENVTDLQFLMEWGTSSEGANIYIQNGSLYGGIWEFSDHTFFKHEGLTIGEKYHVVMRYDGDNLKSDFWVNGERVDFQSDISNIPTNVDGDGNGLYFCAMAGSTELYPGEDYTADDSYDHHFYGKIDEVAVYFSYLSDRDIIKHHHIGLLEGIDYDTYSILRFWRLQHDL
jgi:hypothetical protein